MHKHIPLRMKLGRLFNSLHGFDFRENLVEQPALIEELEGFLRLAFGQHPSEFLADTLARHLMDLGCKLLNCPESRRIYLVPEPSGEANRPKHAQLVFGETKLSIPNGTDDPGPQVLLSTDEVEHLIL